MKKILTQSDDSSQSHNGLSITRLRHLIFNAKSNGFETVIRRAEKRILIDEGEFFNWLDRQKGENSEHKK